MGEDRWELLQQFLRLANCGLTDYPRSIRDSLALLTSSLKLEEAALWLLGPGQDAFDQVATATGPQIFSPCARRPGRSTEAEALRLRHPVIRGLNAWYPVFDPGHSYGVLSLRSAEGNPLGAQDREMVAAVCELLGTLARLHHHSREKHERASALDQFRALSAENDRKFREISVLYRISRLMHSTLRLNELMHLILSAATVPDGGGFDRAMLFMVNERSGVLQGMLGVTRQGAEMVLPRQGSGRIWDRPEITPEILEAQRRSHFCRRVVKQRLPLDLNDSALARAALTGQVVFVADPLGEDGSGAVLAEALQLGPYLCAPLLGRERALGVLVVDNQLSAEEITPARRRFLELFVSHAGGAVENSMLVQRLEGAHHDLRETQERLIQGEKMAVLGEMAASVAHELKNPLVSIGGFAQRLARQAAGGSQEQEYSTIIAREVQRMEIMLSNILGFSKKQLLCFGECRLDEVIEEALALATDSLLHTSVRLVVEIAENLPTVQGDEQKLRQVMINFIANALQAMKGGGTLTVRAYRASLRGDAAAAIEIEDTGGGIPPQVLRNIFNPFFTTKEEGTGLGLSISHRIIDQHQGEIEVLNREHGAVFIVHLPAFRKHPSFR